MPKPPYRYIRPVTASLLLPAIILSGCAGGAATARRPEFSFPLLSYSPPEVKRVTLDCGAPLYLLEDHAIPLFSLYAVARAGSAYDPEGKEGLAALTASVMRSGGTKTVAAGDVDEKLDFSGAIAQASTDEDSGAINLSCLSRDINTALPLALDIIMHPEFEESRIELRKEQVKEAIRRWNDEPSDIASREFRMLVYGRHPYAHPVIGEPGSMDKISRRDLVSFHEKHFRPSTMIFGIAGDFDGDAVTDIINQALGDEKSARAGLPPPVTARRERSVDYIPKTTEQAHIIIGHLGVRRDNPDFIKLMVMNEILGGGAFSSRLMERVRTEKGLAYHIGSRFTANVRTGLFLTVCQTKEESATEAVNDILEELKRIKSEPVTEKELTRAKESYINSFVFHFTNPEQIVEQMVDLEFYGLPRDYLNTYVSRVSAVTAEDVLRVAGEYLHPDRATLLILGERSRFREPLDKFGEVRVINVGGEGQAAAQEDSAPAN